MYGLFNSCATPGTPIVPLVLISGKTVGRERCWVLRQLLEAASNLENRCRFINSIKKLAGHLASDVSGRHIRTSVRFINDEISILRLC